MFDVSLYGVDPWGSTPATLVAGGGGLPIVPEIPPEEVSTRVGHDYRFAPIGGWGNPARLWHYDYGEPPVVLTGHRGRALLLVATAKNITRGFRFGPYGPIGTIETVGGNAWRWVGGEETMYPAATIARSSANDDIPAMTWVPDLMEPTLNFGRVLFTGVEPINMAQPAAGVVDLADPGGELEYLLDYIWDGAKIIIKRGLPTLPFSTWAPVGSFTGSAVIASMSKVTVRLRDLGWKLGGTLHDESYDGTGGLGGDPALKGVKKPYCVGYCFNIEPIPLVGNKQIFQWSFTPSAALTQLRHGGVPLTFSADYPTYTALDAATVPSGGYATCLAQSLVRVNVTLNFGIRLDVQGDNSTQDGHATPLTRASICRRIATCYSSDHNLDDLEEIDVPSFQKIEDDHTGTLGYYWKDEISKSEALNYVMMGIAGWWHIRPSGQLAIGYAREPTALLSIQNLPYKSEGMGLIEIVDTMVPRWKTKIGWRKNYGPQTRDALAGSVTQDLATIFEGVSRYAESKNEAINGLYPTAREVLIEGGFWDEVDAQVEAERQQIMMEKERRRYRWEMQIDPFADLINQVVTITGVNRLGMGDSKLLLCVSIDSAGFGATITEWWG